MFFKPQPGLGPQCPTPGKTRLWLKETEKKNKKLCGQSDSPVVTLLSTVALRPSLATLSIQVSIFFGTYDNPFCLCLLVFAE